MVLCIGTPNPVFTAMIAVNELEEAGLTGRPSETTWTSGTENPAPVTGNPRAWPSSRLPRRRSVGNCAAGTTEPGSCHPRRTLDQRDR